MLRRGAGRSALRVALAAIAGAAWLAVQGAAAEPELRVGTSGDYRPFSYASHERAEPEGFDVALLRAWARERGRKLVFVRFHWPKLLADLEHGRFDVAASGVTVRPERSAAGQFTVPIAETAAWALALPADHSGSSWLDRPQVRIAVNAGGHLEQVARASFPRATLIAVPDNGAVIQLLIDEKVDAVVTDDAEAPAWEERAGQSLARIGPLSLDRKAWLVRSDRPELAADLDAWLLAREADGTLAKQRAEWLAAASAPTAKPLAALLAALDERLALMPLVGVAKRRGGLPLVVPEREERVIETALADARAEAQRAGRPPLPDAAVRALFRAQLDAAVQVQTRAVKDPDFAPESVPNLDRALRPALLRIGARIARLLVALPTGLEPDAVREAARSGLRAPYLDDAMRKALADAVAACAPPPAAKPGGRATND